MCISHGDDKTATCDYDCDCNDRDDDDDDDDDGARYAPLPTSDMDTTFTVRALCGLRAASQRLTDCRG